MATQPGSNVDFTRVAFGPGGAEASDVKLRLPNLTVEARALRVAISPWQLLSRRRLAIADLQAKQLSVQATAGDTSTSAEDSPPFTGVLDSFQAPLAWACEKAEADGVLTVLQPGSPAVAVTFQLNGTGLDITRPGRLDFEFTTPGQFIAGFKGTWKFKGTLDFTPGPGERIDALTITGTVTPALSESLRLPPVRLSLSARRTPEGEHYEITCAPEDATGEKTFTFDSRADYARASSHIAGDWKVHGVSGLVAHLLQRTDLPLLTADTTGKFSLNARTGEADATATGAFTGSEWQRFDSSLAAVGQLTGTHAVTLQRRADVWSLTQLDAHAQSDGSQAALHLALTRPVTLPPGGDRDATPWGKLAVEKIPLGWAAPILEVEKITGGEFAGSWSIASPNATSLRFEPIEKLRATNAQIAHASLPAKKNPPLAFEVTSHLTLTADEAFVEIPELLITSAQADQTRANVEARVSLDTLEGKLKATWTSQLPTWLGGPQAPSVTGTLEATGGSERATITALHIGAVHANAKAEAFSLDLLAPLKIDFENLEAVETSEGEVLRFTARDLQLDWAAPLLPGFAITGVIADGASAVRREGREYIVATSTPWTLRDLAVVQGGVPLLRSSHFTAKPEGRVQLHADWTPGDFLGQLQLSGKVAEVFRLRDPAGELQASGQATVSRRGQVTELRAFEFAVKRHDGSALVDLETLHSAVLGATAKSTNIDAQPEWLRLNTAAIPLEWLQPLLPAGMAATGTIEPASFGLKFDLPNAMLQAKKPVAVTLRELRRDGAPQFVDLRIELTPGFILMGNFSAVGVDNLTVSMRGQTTGQGGISLLYLTQDLTLPITTNVDFTHALAPLRGQPAGAAMSLPSAGTARFIYEHDLLTAGKKPVGTFLLYDVPAADGKSMLPKLGARVTQLEHPTEKAGVRLKVEFQYQTAPVWSQINAEFSFLTTSKIPEINTTLHGDFFDLGSFMQLVDACTPASAPTPEPAPQKLQPAIAANPSLPSPTTETLEGPFWQTISGRFDLDFKQLVYDTYQINDLKGELVFDAEAVHLRQLTGRMFDGEWSGNLKMDYAWQRPAKPYGLAGGFAVKNFSAAKIVQAAYPNELGSFSGRLNFSSTLESQTSSPLDLIDQSTTHFEFSSTDGRLKLDVPYADVASAGLIVGGAITFSPELRALGRLIKKFSDLPVDTLSARGQRGPDGSVSLDAFTLATPQLRLTASGRVPFAPDLDLAARPFELPVRIEAKDEIAVILRGMKLLEKKAGTDGFFAMTRRPTLRGTLGQPDTTELYDTFAQAVDASTGTFGLLMKKVRKEVEKAQPPATKKP